MSEQYFSQKPQSKSNPNTWNFEIREKVYTFTSDEGVFSKNKVDFGTRLLLEQFTCPNIAGDLLDLGCGYGPIGIVLANTCKERHIVMVDINERAVMLTKENIAQNSVDNIEVIQSNHFHELENKRFAAILTNPPIRAGKKLVHEMFEESKRFLCKNGELWVVIQKKQGAPSAKKKLEEIFEEVEVVARSKGYFILKAKNI